MSLSVNFNSGGDPELLSSKFGIDTHKIIQSYFLANYPEDGAIQRGEDEYQVNVQKNMSGGDTSMP